MKIAVLSSLMLTLCVPLNASATDVYKWIDSNGVPSYGERPPEGVEYVQVKIYGASSSTKTGSYYSMPVAAPNKTTVESNPSAPGSSAPKNTKP
ncbi:MAG: DUF4124 domain-containing protein [Motiliproteus sp.]